MNDVNASETERKIAIVTGCTAGIGLELAQAFVAAGWDLYAVVRDAAKLDASGLNTTRRSICDLSTRAGVQDALTGLDLAPYSRAVLINNAGRLDPIGPLADIDFAATERTMMLNGLAPLFLSQTFYRAVLAAPGCVGRIIQISSGAAHKPIAGWTSYCASKAAMWRGTEVMAAEMQTDRCKVALLSPGVVDTAMQTLIRQQDEADLPGLAWFVGMHREGKLSDVSVVSAWVLRLLEDDVQSGGESFPHSEVVDLMHE